MAKKKKEGDTKYIKVDLTDESTFKGLYKIREKLGEGSFGKVLRVIGRDGKTYAMKIIKKSKLDPETAVYLNREIEIMRRIHHPNCCRLYNVHKTRMAVYMVLELLQGGDLFHRIVNEEHFDERQAAHVVRGVASTLQYLHSIGVIHRDLKPDNIMFRTPDKNSQVVLADFGLAKHLDTNSKFMSSACGTPSYEAPEVIRRKGKVRSYTSQCDMWSLGVVLYTMLSGREPFRAKHRKELADKICNLRYTFPAKHWKNISFQARNLIENLLVIDPTKRYTPSQVLKHPWIMNPGKGQLNLVNITGYQKNLRVTRGLHSFRKAVKFIIKMNRLRAIVSVDPNRIKNTLGLGSLKASYKSRSVATVSTSRHSLNIQRLTRAFGKDSKLQPIKASAQEPSLHQMVTRSASDPNLLSKPSECRLSLREEPMHTRKKRLLREMDEKKHLFRRSKSMGELIRERNRPVMGETVLIKEIGQKFIGTLGEPYKGRIKFMKKQKYHWIFDEKDRPMVAPLRSIIPTEFKSVKDEIKRMARAKSVFDQKERERRSTALTQNLQLINMFETILCISLEVEGAREQLFQIIVHDLERTAVLLYVDIAAFRKRYDAHHDAPEGKEPAGMRLRANEIYGAFVQPGAPLGCGVPPEISKQVKRALEAKVLSPFLFNDTQAFAIGIIRKTTWNKLTKLWIILLSLWKQSFERNELKEMKSRVKVLRGHMAKPFLRFFGSPALCLDPQGRRTMRDLGIMGIGGVKDDVDQPSLCARKQMEMEKREKKQTEQEDKTKDKSQTEAKPKGELKEVQAAIGEGADIAGRSRKLPPLIPIPENGEPVTPSYARLSPRLLNREFKCDFRRPTGQINPKDIFKEGFLKKKFLTRGGYAIRFVRITLEKEDEQMPKVFLCYYNTIDDEDARLEPTLKMEINEYFKVKQISEDETLFQVLSSFYQKEHKTPNAMYELSNNGLIFRANSRKERDEWMWALSLFIPRNLQIDLTLRVVLENVEYLMDHLHEFLAGASFFKQGSPMSAHLFLFRKYPKLRNQLSGIIREGLIGTLREFFAEEWDPAFGTAWRFFDLLISAVHARTRLSYQKKSYRGNALIPDDMVQMERRMSLVDTFRGEFGKAGSKGLRLSTGSPSAQVSNVAINSRPTPKPMDLDHHLKATLKDESGGDSKEDQGVPRRRPS